MDGYYKDEISATAVPVLPTEQPPVTATPPPSLAATWEKLAVAHRAHKLERQRREEQERQARLEQEKAAAQFEAEAQKRLDLFLKLMEEAGRPGTFDVNVMEGSPTGPIVAQVISGWRVNTGKHRDYDDGVLFLLPTGRS